MLDYSLGPTQLTSLLASNRLKLMVLAQDLSRLKSIEFMLNLCFSVSLEQAGDLFRAGVRIESMPAQEETWLMMKTGDDDDDGSQVDELIGGQQVY